MTKLRGRSSRLITPDLARKGLICSQAKSWMANIALITLRTVRFGVRGPMKVAPLTRVLGVYVKLMQRGGGTEVEMGVNLLLQALVQLLVTVEGGCAEDLFEQCLNSNAGVALISAGDSRRNQGGALWRAFEFNTEELRLIVIISPKTIEAANQAALLIKDFGLKIIFKINAHDSWPWE